MSARIAILALALGALLNAACQRPAGHATCGVDASAVVRDSSVGPLTLGMSFNEVRERCHVLKDTVVPNYEYVEPERVLVVDLGLDTLVVAGSVSPLDTNQTAQRIRAIYVSSPRLSTLDSLRVGMTLRELRHISGLAGGVSEASVWLSVPGHCGLGLAISNPGPFEYGSEMDSHALLRIADTTTVVRIEVSGCES